MWFRSEHHGVGIAFTDATEGNLATHTGDDPAVVRQRRRTVERELGTGARGVRFVHQVHGTTVHDATGTAAPAEAALPGIATTTAWGTPGLDLPSAADALLRERGVSVATAGTDRKAWCTLEHRALYSYRRDTTPQRLAGLVWARNGRGTA